MKSSSEFLNISTWKCDITFKPINLERHVSAGVEGAIVTLAKRVKNNTILLPNTMS